MVWDLHIIYVYNREMRTPDCVCVRLNMTRGKNRGALSPEEKEADSVMVEVL